MRLTADACIAESLVRAMRSAGHDVAYVSEGPPGVADAIVLADAYADGRIVVTEDHDFGALAVRDGRPSQGVLLIELYGVSEDLRNKRVLAVLELGEGVLGGKFTVIEPSRTRSRPVNP